MREATGALFDRIDGSKWSTGAASESDRCGAGYTIPPLVWYIFGVSETCHPVTTKRLVIGQVSVCIGCCCGQTDRGKPAVPVEWLKTEWRQRGLLKNIQLTISGCLMARQYRQLRVLPRDRGVGGREQSRGPDAAAFPGLTEAQTRPVSVTDPFVVFSSPFIHTSSPLINKLSVVKLFTCISV
ncbi:hypothetical protein SBA4_2120011 [Candidatus Sulfopaludibacter sp. SbA4]|nr:hypothetical protein SBA4_2120011 [Candidatus Sulfopaludibacter sp. SbA4]